MIDYLISNHGSQKQKGVTILEYALIAAAITITAVAFFPSIGSYVANAFSKVCSVLDLNK